MVSLSETIYRLRLITRIRSFVHPSFLNCYNVLLLKREEFQG